MPAWHAPASRPTAVHQSLTCRLPCNIQPLQAQLNSLQRQVAIMERQAAKAAADKAAAEAKEASRCVVCSKPWLPLLSL